MMNIEKLKKKRQLNVEEQNALVKYRIYQEATYWRRIGIPKVLQHALEKKGIDVSTSILLNYEQDFPGISTDVGIVLTNNHEFFEFDIDMDADRNKIIEFCSWKNVTDQFEINGHKLGIGATQGFLAIEVLAEINFSGDSSLSK